MSSPAKIQNNSFVRYIVSSQNVKGTFLLTDPLPGDFSKLFFFGNQVSHGTSVWAEFNGRELNSLRRGESHRNHRTGCLRASLTLLAPPNNQKLKFVAKIGIYFFLTFCLSWRSSVVDQSLSSVLIKIWKAALISVSTWKGFACW